MLEEEEFVLLEMLLDGEHKLLLKILLEMLELVEIITNHTLWPLLNQTLSIKVATNQTPFGEMEFKIIDSVKYYIWLSI